MTEKSKEKRGKPQSGKYGQIDKRKKMLTAETKKVIGGIIIQGKHKNLISTNHNETFVNI